MSNLDLILMNNRSRAIKTATELFSRLTVKDISQPKTIEEARANLRRFYGCVDGNLVVLVHTYNSKKAPVDLRAGRRVNGEWVYKYAKDRKRAPLHSAILKVETEQPYHYVTIDINALQGLDDLYSVTRSGLLYGTPDPSFTMNLVINLKEPVVENSPEFHSRLLEQLRESKERVVGEYSSDAWLQDPTAYCLFANDDPALSSYGGYYLYSCKEGFRWRWRQVNNKHLRYLDWLLLGPFAPYQYGKAKEELAA